MHWKNSTCQGFRWLTKSTETIKLYKRNFCRCYSLCFYVSMFRRNWFFRQLNKIATPSGEFKLLAKMSSVMSLVWLIWLQYRLPFLIFLGSSLVLDLSLKSRFLVPLWLVLCSYFLLIQKWSARYAVIYGKNTGVIESNLWSKIGS